MSQRLSKYLGAAIALTALLCVVASSASAQGARGRVENSPGVVIFKRYSWSTPTDVLAAEFVSFVDRRAEFQASRGYLQFRLPQNQVRQISADTLVEILLFSEITSPPEILTTADETAIRDRLARVERFAGYSEAIALVLDPYRVALQSDLEQFAAGRIKQAGTWKERDDHITARVETLRQEISSVEGMGRKELEARIKSLRDEGLSGTAFDRHVRALREHWVGLRLDRIATSIQAGRGRESADRLEELRMDIGSMGLPQELQARMTAMQTTAADLVQEARRQDLLDELRDPTTADGRRAGVLRELDTIGVHADEDKALVETTRTTLNRRQESTQAVRLLTAETNSLFDTASLRKAESGAYFQSGDSSLRDLSAKIAQAFEDLPQSESTARTTLADLQSLIETAGQLNFYLSGEDWKPVPELLARFREISARAGAGQTFISQVDRQVSERRTEVAKLIEQAKAREAAGRQSEALLLYLEANEMLPDERAQREVRRLRQEALGL